MAGGSADYGFGRVLGEGAFATVLMARRKSDGEDLAVKVMLKSHVEREGKTRLVLAESKALQRCSACAFVVNLSRTFQDADYLFFVLEFCGGGDLLGLINGSDARVSREAGGLVPYAAAFYASEVVLGLEFLRGLNVAHRDLKPENVLVDARGHAKLGDFGAVLDCDHPAGHDLGERHGSFEGTAEYVSPEALFPPRPRSLPFAALVRTYSDARSRRCSRARRRRPPATSGPWAASSTS